MGAWSEIGSSIWGAVLAAILTLLALSFFTKKGSPLLARLLSVVVAVIVWIAAQIYKEFTGEGVDDIVRHYLAGRACRLLGLCKPGTGQPPSVHVQGLSSLFESPAELAANAVGLCLLSLVFYLVAVGLIKMLHIDLEEMNRIGNLRRRVGYSQPIGEFYADPRNFILVPITSRSSHSSFP